MRRNGDNCNHIFAGAVVPEDAVGSGCVVLGLGFEDFFSILVVHGRIFVSV
jgi:hypothetical protein